MFRVFVAVVLSLVASTAMVRTASADDRAARAKVLYEKGEVAFSRGDFETAYEQFKQAYLIAKVPALLYDMGSALERLQRPHEAANELKAYLRALPEEPRRAAIESRIRALEEAQRILDAELLKRSPPILQPLPPPKPYWTSRRIGGAAAGIVLGVAAIATGIGVGLVYGRPDYTSSPLGLVRATP